MEKQLTGIKFKATWKFLRAEVEGIDMDIPILRVECSREYVEKLEAELIFRILKSIVEKYTS